MVGEAYLLITVYPVINLKYINIYGRDITEVRRAESRARGISGADSCVPIEHHGRDGTGLAHELNQPLSAIANYANGCVRRLPADIDSR